MPPDRLIVSWLINALWQLPVLTLAAVACDRALRPAPARYRHWLWTAVLAAAVVLPLPRWNSMPASPQATAASPAASPAAVTAHAPAARPVEEALTSPVRVEVAPWLMWTAVWGWAVVAVWQTALLFRAWRRTRDLAETAFALPIGPVMTQALARCRRAFALKDVPVLCSRQIAGPVTVGAFRPVILLPESLFACESPDLLSTALAHEMAHIRRKDFLFNLFWEALHLPVAFHPAAAYSRRRIAETREMACDEMVTERMMPAERYARALVDIAASLRAPEREGYTLGVFDGGILEQRIRSLVAPGRRLGQAVARAWFAALGGSLAAVAAVAATLAVAPVDPPGSLAGVVVDPSGALAPNALITVIDAAGIRRETRSGPDGAFAFERLAPGPYRIQVRSRGFRLFETPAVDVRTGSPARVRALLELGRIRESITVRGEL